MDDIVKRLRDAGSPEAAKEIERLRNEAAHDAMVISRLNSGDELQSLMAENNQLREQRDAAIKDYNDELAKTQRLVLSLTGRNERM